jgi:hypothetical protein
MTKKNEKKIQKAHIETKAQNLPAEENRRSCSEDKVKHI